MTLVWGLLLGAGLVLAASPWLWPRRDSTLTRDRGALRRLLAEAGAGRLGVAGFVVASSACAAVAAALVLLVTRSPALALVGLVAAATVPLFVLRGGRARRAASRRSWWPDVCDLLVASVRAGMGVPEAVASLAEAAPEALRPAFRRYQSDLHASGHFDSAVTRLKDELADATADRIIETLRMARQVGGTELPGVLRSLSAAVRAEAAVRGEVQARQSWIRGAAIVGVISPWAILAMLLTRPDAAEAYATPTGVALIVGAAVVSVVAFRLMLRIGRLAEPRRWFG